MNATPVWYLTERLMKSRRRMWRIDDQGMLRYGQGELEFIGRHQTIRASRIRAVRLERRPLAYSSWSVIVAIPLVVLVVLLSIDDPMIKTVLALGLGVGLALGVTINRLQVYVGVEGDDEAGGPFVAYFHGATAGGVGGIVGGTRRLAAELEP